MKALNRPLVLGHRGARREAPENTLPAFRRALEQGADGVELDVRMTADGEVVVIHDAELERTTTGRGPVAQVTLAELRRLDAGAWFSPDFAGTRVPTLAEALEALSAAALVNVELKGPVGELGLEKRVLEVVRSSGRIRQVVFSSFTPMHLWWLRRLDRRANLALLYYPNPLDRTLLVLARALRLSALHPAHQNLTRRFVCQAHRRGLRVVPWSVNEEAEVRRMVAWGVDAIITDEPGKVRAWVEGQVAAIGDRPARASDLAADG